MPRLTRRSLIAATGTTLSAGSLAGCLDDDSDRDGHRVVVTNRRDAQAVLDVILTVDDEPDAVAYEYALDGGTTDESRARPLRPNRVIVAVDGDRVTKRRLSTPSCAETETIRVGVTVRDGEVEVGHVCSG